MSDENSSNSMLTFLLVFMLGFFFSKLMPDICKSMTRSGIMDNVANPSNGILQGFKVGADGCGSNNHPPNQHERFTVGGQRCSGSQSPQPQPQQQPFRVGGQEEQPRTFSR